MTGLVNALIGILIALLLGNGLQHFLLPLIPGPVLGMILMFLFLILNGRSSEALDTSAHWLIKYLSLFFIPMTVGIWFLSTEIKRQWLGIFLATVPATLIAQIGVAWLLNRLLQRNTSGE